MVSIIKAEEIFNQLKLAIGFKTIYNPKKPIEIILNYNSQQFYVLPRNGIVEDLLGEPSWEEIIKIFPKLKDREFLYIKFIFNSPFPFSVGSEEIFNKGDI